MNRELIGRLPIIIRLNDINNDRVVLKDILLNSDESKLIYIINAISNMGIEIINLDEAVDFMVEAAIKRNIGARGLISSTIKTFLKIFYEIGNSPETYGQIIIGKNIVNDNNDFILVPKSAKKRVLTAEE